MSSCECQCDKSCGIGEYLDYKNCKCRKRLVNKLTDESNETIDEEKPTPAENENSYKCNFCTVDTVLFSIFFTINVGISAYFPHYKYMNRKKINISKYYDYFCHRKSY